MKMLTKFSMHFLILLSASSFARGSEEYERLYHPGFTHPDSPYNYAPVRPIQKIQAIAVMHSDYGVEGTILFEQAYYEGAPVKITGKLTGIQVDHTIARPPSAAPPEEFTYPSSVYLDGPPSIAPPFSHRDSPLDDFPENEFDSDFFRRYNPRPRGPESRFPVLLRNYDPKPIGGLSAGPVQMESGERLATESIYKTALENSRTEETIDQERSSAESLPQTSAKLIPPPFAPTAAGSGYVPISSKTLHAIHIHQYGDLRNKCASAGEHFNPDWTPHGGPNDYVRHAGDLGSIFSDGNFQIEDNHISLFGRTNIIGRSIVIHESPDDNGRGGTRTSRKSGSSGRRIACGIIAKKDVVYHEL